MNTVTQMHKSRTPSAPTAASVALAAGAIPDIVDDLMNTESLHAAMERLRAAK